MYLNPVSTSVSPVQVSGHPVYSNAIWVVDLRGNQHHCIAAIDVGSPDGPNLIICPIDITLNRVIVYSYGMANVVNLHEQRNNDEYMRVQEDRTDKFVYVCEFTCSTMSVKSGRSSEILLRSVRRASSKTCSAPKQTTQDLIIVKC